MDALAVVLENQRSLEPRISELGLGPPKIESGACELPPEGSKKNVWISVHGIRRGSASRRVDALNYPTNPPNLPKPQTSPQGGGFTLPLPLPRRHFSADCSFSWNPLGHPDPSKSSCKTNTFSTFSLLGPT